MLFLDLHHVDGIYLHVICMWAYQFLCVFPLREGLTEAKVSKLEKRHQYLEVHLHNIYGTSSGMYGIPHNLASIYTHVHKGYKGVENNLMY